jgi:hypothetical protein
VASLREQILANFAAVVDGATTAGVHRAGFLLREHSESPAIAIAPSGEQVDNARGLYVTHTLSIRLSIYARGAIPDQAADAVAVAVHAALMADETLSGKAMRLSLESTNWQFDTDDVDAVRVDAIYQVIYNARRSALDQRP